MQEVVEAGDVLGEKLLGLDPEQDGGCEQDLAGNEEVRFLELVDRLEVALRQQGDIDVPRVHLLRLDEVQQEALPGDLILLQQHLIDLVLHGSLRPFSVNKC